MYHHCTDGNPNNIPEAKTEEEVPVAEEVVVDEDEAAVEVEPPTQLTFPGVLPV